MRVKTKSLVLNSADEKLVRGLLEDNLRLHQEEFGNSKDPDELDREIQMENLIYRLDHQVAK